MPPRSVDIMESMYLPQLHDSRYDTQFQQKDSFMVILLSESQFMNASLPMLMTVLGISTCLSRLHPKNVPGSIRVTTSGIEIVFAYSQ